MDKKFSSQRAAAGAEHLFWLGRALEAREDQRTQKPLPAPRHSVRRALGLEALVNHGLTYSTPWRVRDLSMNGAFLEMDTAELPEGEIVEFVLRYRYKNNFFEHRIPATITRIDHDGVALTFGRYDDQTYTDLANLLYAM